MKKLILCTLLLTISFSAFAQLKTYKKPKKSRMDDQVYHVTKNATGLNNFTASTDLAFIDEQESEEEFKKDSSLNLWSAEQAQKAREEKYPRYGYFVIKTKRRKHDESNAKNLSVIVRDKDGKELFRYTFDKHQWGERHAGSDSHPEYYENLIAFPALTEIPDGAQIFIVDSANQTRYEYVIKR